MQYTPIWLKTALTYVGLREVPGKTHNAKILEWWQKIKLGGVKDDETPWCAGFVGGVLEEVGITSTRSGMARSYTKWGQKLPRPCVGAIVVFWRNSLQSSSGHVGFVVGRDQANNLMVLGGNQGDMVSIKPFANFRVLSYHWPLSQPVPNELGFSTLPIVQSDGKLSSNEA